MLRLFFLFTVMIAIVEMSFAAEVKKSEKPANFEFSNMDSAERLHALFVGQAEEAGLGAFGFPDEKKPGQGLYLLDKKYKRTTKLTFVTAEGQVVWPPNTDKKYGGIAYRDDSNVVMDEEGNKFYNFMFFCTTPEADKTFRMFVCIDTKLTKNSHFDPYQRCIRKKL